VTRTLDWDGCYNVRDLGGVPLPGGRETRSGVLVRSDNVRKLTDDGWRALAEHGIERIVDLRWSEELAADEPRDVDVDVVHVSLLGVLDPDYSDDIEDYMAAGDPVGYWAKLNIQILERHCMMIGAAITAIADADGPVVFHCAGGKDRTGLIAALLLRNAGAAVEDVAADYALTFEALRRSPRTWADEAADEDERRRRTFMLNSPPDAMRLALEHVEREYGDVAGYLRSCGLDDGRIERLRDRLAAA
jgi:protein-tyrosine phosphatase